MVDPAQVFADVVADYKARNAALERRVRFLEWRLEQREEATKNDYEALKPYLEQTRVKILSVFYELPITSDLTPEELQEAFSKKYPAISTVNLYRRARELVGEGKLFSYQDECHHVHFCLRLKEIDETEPISQQILSR